MQLESPQIIRIFCKLPLSFQTIPIMCTVTFIKKGNNEFVLTSNRDETPNRVTLKPELYKVEGTAVLFPKDEKAGGTWIGISDKNRTLCVLNGGFEYHKRKSNYRLSRGIVVKDLLISNNIYEAIDDYDLHDVEPFTLILVEYDPDLKLFELVWDGSKTHLSELSTEPRIWSSSSLYSSEMKRERHKWFHDFKGSQELTAESLLNFHKTAGEGNLEFGYLMDRGFVKTTSITQIEKHADVLSMTFNDLKMHSFSTKSFKSTQRIED